ncbi:protocadherin alpha-7-like [Tachysurus vachellii]|uniref:protocadherin alpha-7-like n=1 Tax=Tachysurus vachellii TaxID=175792 RepID=UPI00296AF567|nr:protocadherin alpha-7-like [Tachysurus vachellii]
MTSRLYATITAIFRCCIVLFFCGKVFAQIRYSIAEESTHGSVVGNIAKDLSLDLNKLKERRFRIVSGSKDGFLQINQDNGELFVSGNIDREDLCEKSNVCTVNLKTVAENPLEIHYIEVEIKDINDNSPVFPVREKHLEIPENAVSQSTRLPLDAARDLDAGINSLHKYILSTNNYFELDVKTREEEKIPFLILKKQLDREEKPYLNLTLTAYDGGKPERFGSVNISITVVDINDNAPVFDRQVYTVTLEENIEIGSSVVKLHATDLDEGANGQIVYAFDKSVMSKAFDKFEINSNTGEITVKGLIDFEEQRAYEIDIQASDKGHVPLTGHCSIVINIKDVNDNAPEFDVTSLTAEILEDSKPGTTISLISVSDRDSGENGMVMCTLADGIAFELKPSFQKNMYSLVTKDHLDRETVSIYTINVMCKDIGEPSLSSQKTIHVNIADVNDNKPVFTQNPFNFYISENNTPGMSILSISAFDIDQNENARITYRILKAEAHDANIVSYLNINSEDGIVYALKRFDYETIKTFQFHIVATDSGTPSLSSNVTVNVFILDQNDNVPVILHPVSTNGSVEGVEEIPHNVNAGHLVTKVRAYDADIGYNGWLLFSLQEVSDHSLFGLDRYTGQIRTLRPFTETDEAEHKLVILVKDNGNISLSATATVIIKLVETKEAFESFDVKSAVNNEEENSVVFYLIITLASVSVLFIISIIVLIVMQCSKSTDYSSKYLQDTNYDGTLCNSIQYRSGNKQYMLVGPRMSIGSTIISGSNGNTLVIPDHRTRASGEVRQSYFFIFCRNTLYI